MYTIMNVITIITLLFVAYQVYLNKETLKLTEKTLDMTKVNIESEQKLRTIQHLNDINKATNVNAFMQVCLNTLNKLILDLNSILEHHDKEKAEKIYMKYNVPFKDIFIYNNLISELPEWLNQLYITSASYYYHGLRYAISIWDPCNEKLRVDLINFVINDIKKDINSIKELSEYILDFIPEVFYECPYY